MFLSLSINNLLNYPKLLCVFTMILTTSMNAIIAQPPSNDYQLLFEDNFTGEKVNEKHWSFRTGARTGANIDSWNVQENVYQKDSSLHVVVRQEMVNGKLQNTGGGIISKHQFGFGFYECLSKPFMAGKGVHSAFWQAGGLTGNNRIFEIDGYEIDSKVPMGCNNLYVHIAPPGYKEVPWPCRANVPIQFLKDGWFLDAYEYTPQGVIFYDNGQIVAKAEWNELTAAQVVWLTALNGVGTVDADKLPGETLFKYFRYYAKPYPGINLLPNGNFEYNMGKTMWRAPIAWTLESGKNAVNIEQDDDKKGYYLQLGNTIESTGVSISQKLEYILNDTYTLTAKVRTSSPTLKAKLKVTGIGGKDRVLKIQPSSDWTNITLDNITVTSNTAIIMVESASDAGLALEIDDVKFFKPLEKESHVPSAPQMLFTGDPVWQIGMTDTLNFTGDNKFYFFDRNVGLGDSVTIQMYLMARKESNAVVMSRMPKLGKSGWSVQLLPGGAVAFNIGSIVDHKTVVAKNAFKYGQPFKLTIVYEKGEAEIFINDQLEKREQVADYNLNDVTAAGRLGDTGAAFEAVGEVIVNTETNDGRVKPGIFSGTVHGLTIRNIIVAK